MNWQYNDLYTYFINHLCYSIVIVFTKSQNKQLSWRKYILLTTGKDIKKKTWSVTKHSSLHCLPQAKRLSSSLSMWTLQSVNLYISLCCHIHFYSLFTTVCQEGTPSKKSLCRNASYSNIKLIVEWLQKS